MAVHSVQPRHTAVPRSLPPNMLSLVITVTVLTHGLALAASPAPQDCVDVAVYGRHSIGVKKFTAKEAKLLFFPDKGFTGVNITLAAGKDKYTQRVTREGLCVNGTQWYSLEVTVVYKDSHYFYTYKTNYSNYTTFSQYNYWDNFKSITVVAHGASFWSLDTITHTTQCATPVLAHTTPACTHSDAETLLLWLAGVGGGAVVVVVAVAAVVIVVCTATYWLLPLRSRKQQQQLQMSSNDSRPQPYGHSNAGNSARPSPSTGKHIIENDIYEPFDKYNDPVHASPRYGEAPHVIQNDLYEPFTGYRHGHDQ